MPTYEYECELCHHRFEVQQGIRNAALTQCPQCSGKIRRLISQGTSFILKRDGARRSGGKEPSCSLEQYGQTCCGQNKRCDTPSCEQGK